MPASCTESISFLISGDFSFSSTTSLIPMTILIGVRSSWDTFERKTAFCRPAVSSSLSVLSKSLRVSSRRLIRYLAMEIAPTVTQTPSTRRTTSVSSISDVIVPSTSQWYINSTTYKTAVINNSRFLSNIEKTKIIIQATAGISNKLLLCTPKKKNPTINSPVQRFW